MVHRSIEATTTVPEQVGVDDSYASAKGLEAVRRELTEKVVTFNLDRIILLRKRKLKAQAPPKAG